MDDKSKKIWKFIIGGMVAMAILVVLISFLTPSMELDEATLSNTYYFNDISTERNNSNPEGYYNILIPVHCDRKYESVEAVIGLYNEEGQKVGYVLSSYEGYEDIHYGINNWKGKNTPKDFVINATALVESEKKEVSSMSEYSSTIDFDKKAEKNITDRTPVYAELWLYDTSKTNSDGKHPLIADKVTKIKHV